MYVLKHYRTRTYAPYVDNVLLDTIIVGLGGK